MGRVGRQFERTLEVVPAPREPEPPAQRPAAAAKKAGRALETTSGAGAGGGVVVKLTIYKGLDRLGEAKVGQLLAAGAAVSSVGAAGSDRGVCRARPGALRVTAARAPRLRLAPVGGYRGWCRGAASATPAEGCRGGGNRADL